jgi:hypothetical protein
MNLFQELSEIFSDDNNQLMAREVLNREGTAKFADPETCNTIKGHRRNKSWGWSTTRSKKSPLFDIVSCFLFVLSVIHFFFLLLTAKLHSTGHRSLSGNVSDRLNHDRHCH